MKPSLYNTLQSLLADDLRQSARQLQDLLNPLLFFAIVVFLFPLTTDASPTQLQTCAPGAIWIAALLATLLSLDKLFYYDHLNGTLEQLLLSPYPLPFLVLAKILGHWLSTGLPLLFITPFLGILLDLPSYTVKIMIISLALGTPILSLMGATITALVVGLRYRSFLLPLLTLPMLIPVLIFGSNCFAAAQKGLPTGGSFAFLGALLLLSLALSPFATASALRIGINNACH
jgi:heme exporter protein B